MMQAVQLFGKNVIKNVEIPQPQIKDNEILVQVKAAAICGSDVRMIQNGYPGVNETHPLTLGHEVSGIIVKIGAAVLGYEVGQRVAIAPNMGCGICDQCVSGNTHLCPNYQAFGINLPGGFAQYLKIPAKAVRQGNLAPLPKELDFATAAIVEPLSCVFNGQKIARVYPGDKVLIIGAGPIGIMHAMLAMAQGAQSVMMNDLNESRLQVAHEILPDLITVSNADLKAAVAENTDQKGVDLCIIAAPAAPAQEASFDYMAINGRLLFFGGLPQNREPVKLNTNLLHYKQLRLYGCTRASLSTYRQTLAFAASSRLPLSKLITARYAIDDFSLAYQNARDGQGLKNVIEFK